MYTREKTVLELVYYTQFGKIYIQTLLKLYPKRFQVDLLIELG